MCDLTITIDRVLSFLTTRRHLLFFYSYPQGYPTEPIETMLRRHGNDMSLRCSYKIAKNGVSLFPLKYLPTSFKDPLLLPH